MSILTTALKTSMATAYGTNTPYMALVSSAPSSTTGTELSGGSPAYGRQASNWGTATNGVITASPSAFNVGSGSSVAGIEFYSAQTVGTYLDGTTVTTQAFASQGTYAVTATYTQS